MKYLLGGVVYGLGFALTYFISVQEPVERLLKSTGQMYHPLKAGLLFTLGYWIKALATAVRPR